MSKKAKAQTAKGIILNPKGQILILKTRKGVWDFAGGNSSGKDKTLPDTLLREVREETGLKPLSYIHIGKWEFEGKLRNLFLVEATSRNIKLDKNEHTEFKWIEPSELKDYDLKPKLRTLCLLFKKANKMKTQDALSGKPKSSKRTKAVQNAMKLAA